MSVSGNTSQSTDSNDTAVQLLRPRRQLSESVKKDSRGAIKAAVDALSLVASLTQGVPYIGAISSALNAVLKTYNEVNAYKTEWKAVANISQKIKEIVDEAHAQCAELTGPRGESLNPVILEPLLKLEESLIRTVETLNVCMPATGNGLRKKFAGLARSVLNRGDLADTVKQCRAELQMTLDLFNTRLHIGQALNVQYLVDRFEERARVNEVPRPVVIPASINLPLAPAIFHGREEEVDHVVDLIIQKAPARVAILGPGGIGKTSIALTVLHSSEVSERYADRRFFMSCEAVSTADGIMQELFRVLGLVHDNKTGISPIDTLLSHFEALPDGIMCLDNLETPWDADIQAVENLLSRIAGLSRIALLVTTRGADRPKQVPWTRPFLSPIEPLSFDAALGIWDSICDAHDEFSEMLIEAVDCVPLAVTLLAHLAEAESPEMLWVRWKQERTELLRVRGPDHRLNSVDVSVQMSLQGPRLRSENGVVKFFSVLCVLPQGMPESRIHVFEEAYVEMIPNLRRSITLLKQCSLAYSSRDGFLRVLSPVRSYVLSKYPISEGPFIRLVEIYIELSRVEFEDKAEAVHYARTILQSELVNITTILRLSLSLEGQRLESVLVAIHSFTRLCGHILRPDLPDTGLLTEAISSAGDQYPAHVAKLWQSKGLFELMLDRAHDALPAFSKLLDYYTFTGNEWGKGLALQGIGRCHYQLGDFEEAEPLLLSCIDVFRELPGDKNAAEDSVIALRCLGSVYYCRGQFDKAEHVLKDALRLAREIGFRSAEANVYGSLGLVYARQNRHEERMKVLQSAIAVRDEMGDDEGKALALEDLGLLYDDLGQHAQAETLLLVVLQKFRDVGDHISEMRTMTTLGCVYRNMHRREEAFMTLVSAYALACTWSHRNGQADIDFELEKLYADYREFDRAQECLHRALDLYSQIRADADARQTERYIRAVAKYAARTMDDGHNELDRQSRTQERGGSELAIQA